MTATLYRAAGPVTLVGAGPVRPAQLAQALALAPEPVAADGGADLTLPAGHGFRAVIGDMDSISGATALRGRGVPVHHIPEQESNDLEKCLYSVDAPLFLGLGFLGGRIDHHLAALNALAKYPDKRLVLIGDADVCFLCPPVLELDLPPGSRVSLFPMGPARGLLSEGLRWPVAGLAMAPDARVGTSNLALGGTVRIGFDAPKVLVILPQEQLRQVALRLGA